MKTNDLKKGARVKLANGWYATIFDNARGNTRMATVEGIETETGSVYAHDIVLYRNGDTDDCLWLKVEHTPAQLALKRDVEALFG